MDKLKFALHVKGLSIPLYEKVFDIEYPLPKLDTLAVRDFNGELPLGFSLANPPSNPKCSGAMENWGLIIGSSTALAIDANSEDLRTKKDIAYTQCHEVAHMWCVLSLHWIAHILTGQRDRFGDIATMEWWDNLYLNEGMCLQDACTIALLTFVNVRPRFCNVGK